MGVKKHYFIVCDNRFCSTLNTSPYDNKEDAIRWFLKFSWIIDGDKTYCCPECQKEAEENEC
jgi:hypothetical protein